MVQLTSKEVQHNKSVFLALNEKYDVLPKELLEFLGDDLFVAPASNLTSLYNACVGGLVDHTLKVVGYAKKINDMLPEAIKQPSLSVLKVSMLFDIGKTFIFVENKNQYSYMTYGKIYDYAPDSVSMKTGERSAYYALKYMDLSEEEYQAIVSSDKPTDDSQAEWYASTLTTILRLAIKMAIIEERSKG